MTTSRFGVLALQGDFAAHRAALRDLGAESIEVRRANDLAWIDGLVIPGGESTTLLRLLEGTGIEQAARELLKRGGAVFGTCAGAILLASRVIQPEQSSWKLLDATIERNSYGRQTDSFEGAATHTGLGEGPLPVVFIRAPRIREVGPGVEVLAELEGFPVLVRQGPVLAATFHPELTADRRVHRLFVEMASRARPAVAGERRA